MDLSKESPFQVRLNFSEPIKRLERKMQQPGSDALPATALLLKELKAHPYLWEGITDPSQIFDNEDLIKSLLTDYFPEALTSNEIKAVNLPYHGLFFNHTERFKKILEDAGQQFAVNIRDFNDKEFYILSCCIILNEHYGTNLDFYRPLFYDIPTKEGLMKHYRILYNTDFLETAPTETSLTLSEGDIKLLKDNYDDLQLWEEKFPPRSWILKGFSIITLVDATVENAVSILKENLLRIHSSDLNWSIESVFRSIFHLNDLRVGFTVFNREENKLSTEKYGQQLESLILPGGRSVAAVGYLTEEIYQRVLVHHNYLAVSKAISFAEGASPATLAAHMLFKGFKSYLLAPVVKNGRIFGILEVTSGMEDVLNSVSANKLDSVMPFIVDAIANFALEFQNQVQATIQNTYTTIHESVYWKFRKQAQKIVLNSRYNKQEPLKDIKFESLYPLYGQVDIRGSSEARNFSIQQDLQTLVSESARVLQQLAIMEHAAGFEKEINQLEKYADLLKGPIQADTEQYISAYIDRNIYPLIHSAKHPLATGLAEEYKKDTDKSTGSFHESRRKYETAISNINTNLAAVLDKRQVEAQKIYPHFYERFITDGVDHNLYIGASISPTRPFLQKYLYQLRLWQLETLCEMEQMHQRIIAGLPFQLEVTSLVLVYSVPIDIRFRLDEKRFDVDGSYNARFEIVKKRIDKAHIRDSRQRIAHAGKLTIVYTSDSEEKEYEKYIEILQVKGVLKNVIEKLQVEDLQGVAGLKALRVDIGHD